MPLDTAGFNNTSRYLHTSSKIHNALRGKKMQYWRTASLNNLDKITQIAYNWN